MQLQIYSSFKQLLGCRTSGKLRNEPVSLKKVKSYILFPRPIAHLNRHLSPVSIMLRYEDLTTPGQETDPLQVSSQQMLFKGWKTEKTLAEKRLHKYSNLGKAVDQTGNLVARMQRSYQLHQPRPPQIWETRKNWFPSLQFAGARQTCKLLAK